MCSKNLIFTVSRTLIVVLTLAHSVQADEPPQEYKVKAAFVYNFAEFIEWPDVAFANTDAPFAIAVIGNDPFNGILEQVIAGKKIAGRSVVIKHFNSSDDISSCQVLFIPATEDEHLEQIIQKVQDGPILTIGETERFPWAGGCFRFYTEDNKIRFEINQGAAARAGLRISSKLLRLAKIFQK
jgi:hypothetical protein